jgi:hypothetical protein
MGKIKVEKIVGKGCSAQSHSAQAKVPLGFLGSTALLVIAQRVALFLRLFCSQEVSFRQTAILESFTLNFQEENLDMQVDINKLEPRRLNLGHESFKIGEIDG